MAEPQKFFKGRQPEKFTVTPPPPPPEEMVRLEMTPQEFKVIREAAYYYWAMFQPGAPMQGEYWNNPTTGFSHFPVPRLSDEECAKLAQDFFDHYSL